MKRTDFTKFLAVQRKNARNVTIRITVGMLIFGLIFALIGTTLIVQTVFKEPDVLVGVDIGFGDEKDVYMVADAIQDYANLIIIGSLNITKDTPKLTRVCDYLYQRGFSFIVYVGFAKQGDFPPQGPSSEFFNTTAGRWGNKFLGAYMFDEPGGKQMDYSISQNNKPVPRANNDSDAAIHFILSLEPYMSLYKGRAFYASPWLQLYTSDYALHWFDYLSGYDVVLGEFAGNQSKQLAVALTRGAAETLGGKWGIMITWAYDQPPYLENGTQIFNDMKLSYDNGAKYIVLFNSPGQNTNTTNYGILKPEHFDAMKKFWDYAKDNPQPAKSPADVAYVLPGDFGYGFRGPNDTIWGLWPADAIARKTWIELNNTLLPIYGMRLNVVYENTTDNVPAKLSYPTLIFWNGTMLTK